eukprot:9869275-Karenia_brevis.AAC.1
MISWAEAIEGLVAGDATWSRLARFRCRLILGSIPHGVDRIEEIKTRLRLWETGAMGELASRVQGQTVTRLEESQREAGKADFDTRAGRQACSKARKNAYRKAVMTFAGSPAEGTAQDR